MNKKIWAIIIGLPVMIILILGYFLFFNNFSTNKEKNRLTENTETKADKKTNEQKSLISNQSNKPPSNNNSGLPFPISDPSLREVNLNFQPNLVRYNFIGKVASIVETEGGKNIVLDSTSQNLPVFKINDQTRYFLQNETTFVQAEGKVLTAGKKVELSMDWDKEKRIWNLTDIYIYIYN